jgi:hypothetical protein
MPDNKNSESDPNTRDRARRRAQNHFTVQAERDALVKQELAAERAVSDAKTAKLRALRLAKEEADRETARIAAETAPAKKVSKKAKAR